MRCNPSIFVSKRLLWVLGIKCSLTIKTRLNRKIGGFSCV
uniref:Uncharacterized protein n=1 Tax=Siphoviridae sp. ctDmR33 TaxID=2825389 RepID=A0A8S5UX45_9CAUD|nr:MAG TPA: hypothetical protein [Siphoviridae sp. ctDmR33]